MSKKRIPMHKQEEWDVYMTRKRPQITDLDGMPLLNRSLVDYTKYNQFIGQAMVKDCMSLQATRGCPYRCVYCHKVWPKTHVVRSAENIFAEIHLYYRMGVTRFSFVDDIFNLDVKNSTRFYQLIVKNRLNESIQLYFPNGLRGDILTRDYIDLMVEAGTVNIAFALESGSPRIQELIKKHLDIDKLRRNIEYTNEVYPWLITELQTMHGFPTETEEEAMMTLDFIFSLKNLDFPYVNVLKIYPNTDMEKLALENGVSRENIEKSRNLAYDELPFTLPFNKNFSYKYQAKFLHEYFLKKERLLTVLPQQMKLFSEGELMQKYCSYLPGKFNVLSDLLEITGIDEAELGGSGCAAENAHFVPNLNEKIRGYFPASRPDKDALRIFLLDLTRFFSEGRKVLYDVVEAPLGLMCLLTYLENQKGTRIKGKIAKSRIDFDNYWELKELLDEMQPDVIGVRSMSLFKEFFHETAENIRRWGFQTPIIAGGPYAVSEYSLILKDPNIDLVVLGEGEVTFCEIITRIMENNGKLPGDNVLKEIAGIAFVPGKSGKEKKDSEKFLTREVIESKRKEKLAQFNEDLEE